MSLTFGELKAELRLALWPSGEATNLVGPHNKMFVEAMVDLQQFVSCLQINNTQVTAQCDTLFKCGMTVLDAPRGHINRLYTIDRINQTTGLEDASAAEDWCSVVEYRQVDYAELHRYVSTTLAGTWGGAGCWGWAGLNGQIAFPSCWMNKYTFPPPTDYGLENAPPLPLGFHYAQDSTNSPNGNRAQWGMWAIRGGLIYVAPWIQSTEMVIVDWDGIKRSWDDLDLVDDDPSLKKAVEAYVRWKDSDIYQKDYDAASAAEETYLREAVPNLIHECRQESLIRDAAKATASSARGASQITPTFFNDAQTATAKCQDNTTGNPVTMTVPAGTVQSKVSVADANARARSIALQQAGAQLVCTTVVVTYYNTAQSYTAQCVGGLGEPVSRTVGPGQVTSTVSQADANNQALALATQQAIAALSCTYQNRAQPYTAHCPDGFPGADVTVTIAAGLYTSAFSQADADAQALTAATNQAIAALSCAGAPATYQNTVQTVPGSRVCFTPGRPPHTVTSSYTVAAGTFTSQISQADANGQAQAYAHFRVLQQLAILCG